MTFLPIVERELRVTARNSATYRIRMFTPVVVAVLSVIRLLLTPGLGPRALTGADTFATLSSLALAFCVLEGVRKTADCLSGEKREGTLGLLFLTDLKGYDVILGKLAAASLTSLYALFAILPILAWSLLLGGVTFGEVCRVGLASTNILVFSLAAGIWVSARSYSASRAMAGTFLLVALFLFLPLPMVPSPIAPLSPACAFFGASDVAYRLHPLQYWISLLLTAAFSWAFLARASAIINRFCEEGAGDEPTASAQTAAAAISPHNRAKRAKSLDENPISWLANRGQNPTLIVWALVILTCAGIASCLLLMSQEDWAKGQWAKQNPPNALFQPVRFVPVLIRNLDLFLVIFVAIMNSLLKALLASQASRCLAEARRNAALEILLCTPLKIENILQGQINALRRIFLRPALVLLACEMAGLFWLIHDNLGDKQLFATALIGEVAFAIFFLLDLQAVAWVAMWFGLCSKNESRAMFKTIFLTILLPFLFLVLYCLGWALFIFWPVCTLLWARLQLQEQFRALAGYRSSASGEPSAWMAFEIQEAAIDAKKEL